MVAITQMSNVLGTVVPIKEVCASPTRAASRCWSTAARRAVHMPVDVRDLDCDFYVFTGHKTYGPTGIGVLYGKREHLDAMPPYHGRRRDDPRRDARTPSPTASRRRVRGRHAADRAGDRPGRGARLHDAIGRERIAATRPSLRDYAHERLGELNWLRIYGTRARTRAPSSPSAWTALHPHDISTIIDRAGVAVRAGHHCAQPLMARSA